MFVYYCFLASIAAIKGDLYRGGDAGSPLGKPHVFGTKFETLRPLSFFR